MGRWLLLCSWRGVLRLSAAAAVVDVQRSALQLLTAAPCLEQAGNLHTQRWKSTVTSVCWLLAYCCEV